jgi:hypothetical protein
MECSAIFAFQFRLFVGHEKALGARRWALVGRGSTRIRYENVFCATKLPSSARRGAKVALCPEVY